MPNGDEIPRKLNCRRVVRELLAQLTALRDRIAEDEGRTPQTRYLVFDATTLEQMADEQPRTLEEVIVINGVGPYKCERYGERFTGLICDFLCSQQPPTLDSTQLAALLIPVKAVQLALNFPQPVDETVEALLTDSTDGETAHNSRRFRCFLALVAAERCRQNHQENWTDWIEIAIDEGELLAQGAQIDVSKTWGRVRDALDLRSFYQLGDPERTQRFDDAMEDLGISFAVESDGAGRTFFHELKLQRILDDGDSVYPFNVERVVAESPVETDTVVDAVENETAEGEQAAEPTRLAADDPAGDRRDEDLDSNRECRERVESGELDRSMASVPEEIDALLTLRTELIAKTGPLHARFGPSGTWVTHREILQAQLAKRYRDVLTAADERFTQAMIDESVKRDPEFAAFIDEAEKSREKLFVLNGQLTDVTWRLRWISRSSNVGADFNKLDLT
jgi:hypothetical protein